MRRYPGLRYELCCASFVRQHRKRPGGSGRPTLERYPVESLLRLARITVHELSRRSDMDNALIHRYKRQGGFTWSAADICAGACGLHPALVWPAWLEDSIAWAGEWEAKHPEPVSVPVQGSLIAACDEGLGSLVVGL